MVIIPTYVFRTSAFSALERKNDGGRQCSASLKTLLKTLGGRALDYGPAVDALKESWAIWYCLQGPRIQKLALEDGPENREALESELSLFLDAETGRLEVGESANFYHHVAHAMGRSLLHENNGDAVGIDFVIEAWQV